jgi:hypothetical protein
MRPWALVALAVAFAAVTFWRVTAVYDRPAWQAIIPIVLISGLGLFGAVSFWSQRDDQPAQENDEP